MSEEALAVAKSNAAALQVVSRLEFVSGSWFPPGGDRFDLIISNPPYIISRDIPDLSPDVKLYDPLLALDGGLMDWMLTGPLPKGRGQACSSRLCGR